jgi:uncharacterized caspase-like protein
VDASLRVSEKTEFEKKTVLGIQLLLDNVKRAGCRLNVLIMDTDRGCHDSSHQSLRLVLPSDADYLVAFGCAPGESGSDGIGRNGLFTESLLQNLGSPSLDLESMFGQVRAAVYKSTGGRQDPSFVSMLRSRPFLLTPSEAATVAATVAAPSLTATSVAASATLQSIVPSDLAAWLAALQLSAHGPRLVADHKLAFVSDCCHLDEGDLTASGLAKVEARRLLAAAVKLGSAEKRPAIGGFTSTTPAAASGRVRVRALCIGIDAYSTPVPGELENAVADATAVHAALSKLPGTASTLLTNCTKAAFERALTDFRDGVGTCTGGRGMSVTATAATSAELERTLALVFFAGHGLQVHGRNYLIPADFAPPRQHDRLDVMLGDTAAACIALEALEQKLEQAGVFAGAVFLDCCRNVPDFLAELGAKRNAGGGTRALPIGLADAAPEMDNLIVTYATGSGKEAFDRSSRVPNHSPFTAALLMALTAPRRLMELSPFLKDAVDADSGGKQRPQVSGVFGVEAGNLILG